MDPILLVFTICLYILSLVVSLLLGMTSRRFAAESIRLPFAVHAILIFLSIVFLVGFSGQILGHYLLLLGVCSGIALGGWAIRNTWLGWPLRVYLFAYLLSIPVFLWTPSSVFYAISGNYDKWKPEQEFNLESNVFLVEQQSMLQEQVKVRYKVIRKFGIYNKTLIRDVDFGSRLSSAKLIELTSDTLILEGVNQSRALVRLGLKPGMKKNTITRKPSA